MRPTVRVTTRYLHQAKTLLALATYVWQLRHCTCSSLGPLLQTALYAPAELLSALPHSTIVMLHAGHLLHSSPALYPYALLRQSHCAPQLRFTCLADGCQAVNVKPISPTSFQSGTLFAQCGKCGKWHLIKVRVEAKGEQVERELRETGCCVAVAWCSAWCRTQPGAESERVACVLTFGEHLGSRQPHRAPSPGPDGERSLTYQE